ncbi:hypothetical protein [Mucilaginibacter terrae]|uniref:hypothetical protein n=1 Tax=Mucilaginibacter terrae TaxID=1955052 RepID=UPI00366FBFE7
MLKLNEDLKSDLKYLNDVHHVAYCSEKLKGQTKYELNNIKHDLLLFKSISNLKTFKFSSVKQGDFVLNKWIRPKGPIKAIYQLDMKSFVDTVIEFKNIETHEITEKIPVKGTFIYRYYSIEKNGKISRLAYKTQSKQGMHWYSINNKTVSIAYEDILIEPYSLTERFEAAIKKMIPQ